MTRTYIYLPDELDSEITYTAQVKHSSKAAVIREALEHGLKAVRPAQAETSGLQELANVAKRFQSKAPKDLSANLDKYLWDE